MKDDRNQRVRDPVHGLIVFGKDDLDQLAWRLLDTLEMQRLRRIRQLGVSEFVFPSATHSRFVHSIGVFHTARQLIKIIEREISGIEEKFDPDRAETAVLAALLHDLGHGPFSHAFEDVQKERRQRGGDKEKKHEKWSAEIIRNSDGAVFKLLEERREGLAEEIAMLLDREDPRDIYHAIVSSSFDADRLDYLRRDRLMTGTQAGAIDFDWLMEHVRVRRVSIEAADAGEDDLTAQVPTFCLDRKALPAAEQFLLARYTLHEQVYFHKTTRCVEKMMSKLLLRVVDFADSDDAVAKTGLADNHPLLTFFSRDGETLNNYLALDDFVVWGAVEAMSRAVDPIISDLAMRLRERRLYKTLDLGFVGSDVGRQRQKARRIDNDFGAGIRAGTVLKDEGAKISIYTQIGGDEDRTHKKLHILDAEKPKEISELSDLIKALETPRPFTRYYFETESDRDAAKRSRKEGRHD
jgi:HD superfamily phosphohydrolase